MVVLVSPGPSRKVLRLLLATVRFKLKIAEAQQALSWKIATTLAKQLPRAIGVVGSKGKL
jgi:hypothetical protein